MIVAGRFNWLACTEPGMWANDRILRSLILPSFKEEIKNIGKELSRVFYKIKQVKVEVKS